MTPLRRLGAHADPTDVLFMGYVAFTGVMVLGMGWRLESPSVWAGLVAMHALVLGAAALWASTPRTDGSLRGLFRDLYPGLFIGVLYFELRHLARFFSDGFNDGAILALEERIFGEQLAMTLSQRFPALWLSELLHFFYAFYWVLMPLAAGLLFARRRWEGVRELVWALLLTFFACYLVFIFWPVQGPHYEFQNLGPPWSEGFWYGFVHVVLEDGASRGAAFPSSHVAVAVTVLPVAWRHDRTVFGLLFFPVAGLVAGTVYGRFHYGVDALAGVVLALALFPLGLRLRARLGTRTPAPVSPRR